MLCYIILNYNDYTTTLHYVKKIINYNTIDHIIIVDNKSLDNSYYELKSQIKSKKVDIIVTDKNGGYGYGNNFGVKYAIRRYHPSQIVISNPDVEIEETSIKACSDYLVKDNNCAVVVPLMQNIDGSYNYNCVWKIPNYYEYLCFSLLWGKNINFNYPKEYFKLNKFECECVAGSWLMIDPNKFVESGMYDEEIFLYCEETVLGIKIKKKGYTACILPTVHFLHKHSVSISKSIKSDYKQQKIMWKSRLYVLDNYYSSTTLKHAVSRCIYVYALIERRFIQFVRMIKKITRLNL